MGVQNTGKNSARGDNSMISGTSDISGNRSKPQNPMMVHNIFALNGLGYTGLPLNQQYQGLSNMDNLKR